MIRTLRFALVFLALSPIAWAQTPPDPDAALRALELERYRGKVVLVDFWASWCGPCAASFPWMSQMVDTHGDRGFVVIVVNLDEERAAAEAFLTDFEDRFVHVFDDTGAIATALSVDAMPTSILFDREGQPAFRHAGFFPEQQPKYEAHIVSLLKGEATGDPALLAGGTTLRGVRPWQRGRLADPDMLLGGNRLDLAFDDHIYFSKEGSSGGRGFGGGGCGCN